jgi:hypothetical protein
VVETMAVMVVLVTVKYPFPVNVSVLFTRRMACPRVSTSLRKNKTKWRQIGSDSVVEVTEKSQFKHY